jgi:hypothetical protein
MTCWRKTTTMYSNTPTCSSSRRLACRSMEALLEATSTTTLVDPSYIHPRKGQSVLRRQAQSSACSPPCPAGPDARLVRTAAPCGAPAPRAKAARHGSYVHWTRVAGQDMRIFPGATRGWIANWISNAQRYCPLTERTASALTSSMRPRGTW